MSNSKSTLTLLRRIWVAVFTLATIAFMVHAFRQNQLSLADLRLRNPFALAAAAMIHFAFWLVAIAFWKRVVKVTTNQDLSMSDSFHQLSLVAVGKYVPGKVWGFLARGVALKRTETSMTGVFTATFVEQWAMLMSAGLVGGLQLLLLWPNHALAMLGLAAVVTSLFGNHLFRFGVGVSRRLLGTFTGATAPAPGVSIGFRQYFPLLLAHSLMWLLLGLVLCGICFAFSLRPFTLELCAALILANTIGIVAGFVALFAPGGLGVREAFTTALLLPFLPLEQAALLTIVFRLWTTSVDILLAVLLIGQTAWTRYQPQR